MGEYIQESLKAGIIRPSSSPAGAGFFFISNKDRLLADEARTPQLLPGQVGSIF